MTLVVTPRRYPILLTQCHMAACSTMAYGVALTGMVPRVPLKSRCWLPATGCSVLIASLHRLWHVRSAVLEQLMQ